MSIRTKTICIILSFVASLWILISYSLTPSILKVFNQVEERLVKKDLQRVENAVFSDISRISSLVSDWSYWDETYNLMENGDSDYESRNMSDETFGEIHMNVMIFIRTDGSTAIEKSYDYISRKSIKAPEKLLEYIKSSSFSEQLETLNIISGVIDTEKPLMFSANPILTGEKKGPSRGRLLMGRFIDEHVIKDIAERTAQKLRFIDVTDSLYGTILKEMQYSREPAIYTIDNNIIRGYSFISDVWNRPFILVESEFDRDISKNALHVMKSLMQWMHIAIVIFGIIAVILLEKSIIRRITRLTREAAAFGRSNYLWARLHGYGKDEIGKLSEEINDMFVRIQKSQYELASSEMKHRTFINSSPDMIFLKDDAGRYIMANSAMLDFFGKSEAEVLGKTVFDLVEKRTAEYCNAADAAALAGGNVKISHLEMNGREYEQYKFAVRLENGKNGIGGFIKDITELKRAESDHHRLLERLAQAEKMEALGILAGGVAHDLNNLLTPIVAYPDILLKRIPDDERIRRPIEAMKKTSYRAADVVQDLLTLARRGTVSKKVVDIAGIIREYLESSSFLKLQETYDYITVEKRIAPHLPCVEGSETHIYKAIQNLIHNAFEAISEENPGIIEISLSAETVTEKLQLYETIQPGNYLKFKVSDTGSGISSDDIKRIFEPFYTRKIMGRSGTGLGLAVVWGVVRDHSGFINVQSEPGKGTEFTLYLPSTDKKSETFEHLKPENFRGNLERILVVDDIEHQRDTAKELLTDLNYSVDVASSGFEAIEKVKHNTYDVVLLDMIMENGIDGYDTFKEIKKICPAQKAVIVSGFSENERVQKTVDIGAGGYIRKPYTLMDMAVTLKKQLS